MAKVNRSLQLKRPIAHCAELFFVLFLHKKIHRNAKPMTCSCVQFCKHHTHRHSPSSVLPPQTEPKYFTYAADSRYGFRVHRLYLDLNTSFSLLCAGLDKHRTLLAFIVYKSPVRGRTVPCFSHREAKYACFTKQPGSLSPCMHTGIHKAHRDYPCAERWALPSDPC